VIDGSVVAAQVINRLILEKNCTSSRWNSIHRRWAGSSLSWILLS